MGYTTDFEGHVTVDPPLNEHERSYLEDFNNSRRMDREEGPYYAVPGTDHGQTRTPGIRSYNDPPEGQPGLWCQWEALTDGSAIQWDGAEKFYHADRWMEYLIDHFFKPGAHASVDILAPVATDEALKQDARFAHFTFNHTLNGDIYAQGEDSDDRWLLRVRNNVVTVHQGKITYEGVDD